MALGCFWIFRNGSMLPGHSSPDKRIWTIICLQRLISCSSTLHASLSRFHMKKRASWPIICKHQSQQTRNRMYHGTTWPCVVFPFITIVWRAWLTIGSILDRHSKHNIDNNLPISMTRCLRQLVELAEHRQRKLFVLNAMDRHSFFS